MLKFELPVRPELFLLNVLGNIQNKGKKHYSSCEYSSKTVCTKMENAKMPKVEQLIEKLYEIVKMDELTEIMNDSDITKIQGYKNIEACFRTG